MQAGSIPLVTFHGTNREIGRQHGEAFRHVIESFISDLWANLARRGRAGWASKSEVEILMRKHWSFCQEFAPELCQEIEGIAEGSARTLDEILFLNSFLDLVNLRDSRAVASLMGCTAFAALGEATKDSRCYVGQNYEMESFYKKYRVLLRLESKGAPEALVYSYAGVVGCAGFNSFGRGVSINFLHARDVGYGVLYPFIVRKILGQDTLAGAIGAATIGRRAGGTNFIIGDAVGFVCSVEVSGRDHDILYPIQDIIVHSNHYLSPRMRRYDMMVWDPTYASALARRGSTIARLYFGDRMLRKEFGKIDMAFLCRVAAAHQSEPYAICCHGSAADDELSRGETNASFFFDLSERRMLIAPGCPCREEYEYVPLD